MLNQYWNDIPTGKENAVTYKELCLKWNKSERDVRRILHQLSKMDNEDNYILIRSSYHNGFYKTDNVGEIESYRKEVRNRSKNTLAPLRKINRVLNDKCKVNY